jgi:hypothetical protein
MVYNSTTMRTKVINKDNFIFIYLIVAFKLLQEVPGITYKKTTQKGSKGL